MEGTYAIANGGSLLTGGERHVETRQDKSKIVKVKEPRATMAVVTYKKEMACKLEWVKAPPRRVRRKKDLVADRAQVK